MAINKCRTCFKDFLDDEVNVSLKDDVESTISMTVGQKLLLCVPELVLSDTADERMCASCSMLLISAYNFRMICLETEEKYKSFPVALEDYVKVERVDSDITTTENIKAETESVEYDNTILHDETVNYGDGEVIDITQDVITGDISVGFEISNSREIHNTVSVSITTNTESGVKTVSQKHIFQDVEEDALVRSVNISDKKLDNLDKNPDALQSIDGNKFHFVGLEDMKLKAPAECDFKKAILDDVPSKKTSSNDVATKYLIRPRPKCKQLTWALPCFVKLRRMRLYMSALLLENGTVFSCDDCNQYFTSRSKLIKHKHKHIRRRTIQNFMKMRKESERQLKNRIRIVNSKDKDDSTQFEKPDVNTERQKRPTDNATTEIKCKFCKISFSSVNIFNLHMKLHQSEDVTATTSVENEKLKQPIVNDNISNSDSGFECPVCNKMFITRAQLAGHLSTHSDKFKRCHYCGKRFSFCQFQKHVKNVHNKLINTSALTAKNGIDTKSLKIRNSKGVMIKIRKKCILNQVAAKEAVVVKTEDTCSDVNCKLCLQSFKNTMYYDSHICSPASLCEQMYKCKVCEILCSGHKSFTNHITTHTANNIIVINSVSG